MKTVKIFYVFAVLLFTSNTVLAGCDPNVVGGAARGAAGGAMIGAISGNAGRGAAVGAVFGGLRGRR